MGKPCVVPLVPLVVMALVLAACGAGPTPTAKPPLTGTPPGTPPATDVQASATPEPPAAVVDGEAIPMQAYQRAVARCETAVLGLGQDPAGCKASTLDELIERVLIRNAAREMGIVVSDEQVNQQIEQMKSESGGDKFQQWLSDNQYADEDELRGDLRAQMLGGLVFQQVTASVPAVADQVHARHILVASEDEARQILAQLQAGADFAQLAQQFSLDETTRGIGGDLGFFYRGLLTVPEVEQAAFALQPGQLSDVVHSARGYHIVQVLERDGQHPLSQEDIQNVRQQAFKRWLADLWARAKVQKLVGTGT